MGQIFRKLTGFVCAKVANVVEEKTNTYVDYLRSIGESVVDIDGVPWMKYNHALTSATAMPVYDEVNYEKALNALKNTGALFLRYNTIPNADNQDWWQIVCRQYSIASVSANTRSKIHRGLKRMAIRQQDPLWLADNGYTCHIESYARYKKVKPLTKKTFQDFVRGLAGLSLFDLWVCTHSTKLLGYVICLRENDGVFMHTIDITPAGLHDYAAYAMTHTLLEHYVNQLGIPVTNGNRSISHETHMQDFLLKFGFQREYSKLNVIYRRDVELIVKILFPLRKLLRQLDVLPFVHKVSAVLFQEEIIRMQNEKSP